MHRGLSLLCSTALLYGADLRVASFRADVTPKLGEPLIWTMPAKVVADPLWAKGVIIENGRNRLVLCAMDWCGLGNRAHLLFRRKLAEAAGTDLSRVTLHTIHQHTAPYVDSTAYDLLRQSGAGMLMFSDNSLAEVADRVAASVEAAVGKLEPFDQVGVSSTEVERVASDRRIHGPDGKIIVRYSNGAKSRAMAEAPEGDIDRNLRTITLASGGRVLVRLHYYATHPQTFCCEGTVSGDFLGAAREAFEREDGVPQIYFTGAAGDVTVGKYNDGSPEAREALTSRLLAAFRRSAAHPKFAPANDATWKNIPLVLPKKELAEAADAPNDDSSRYRRAITIAFERRKEPLEMSALRLGTVRIVHMPGEPMLAFQRYALSLCPRDFVAFAGYGDIAPGYICTDRAYAEGGYEPSASNTAPGAEAAVKAALRKLLRK